MHRSAVAQDCGEALSQIVYWTCTVPVKPVAGMKV